MVDGQHSTGTRGPAPAGTLRRGLPRTPGGESWPPAGAVAVVETIAAPAPSGLETAPAAPPRPTGAVAAPPVEEGAAAAPPVEEGAAAAPSVEEGAAAAPSVEEGAAGGRSRLETPAADAAARIRRGLPRTPGGEPWPPTASASHLEATADGQVSAPTGLETAPAAPPRPTEEAADAGTATAAAAAPPVEQGAAAPPVEEGAAGGRSRLETPAEAGSTSIRRGLPRVAGGEPWPPAGAVPAAASSSVEERADAVGARLETAAEAPAARGLVTAPSAPPRPAEREQPAAAPVPAAPPRPTEQERPAATAVPAAAARPTDEAAPAAGGLVTAPAAPPRPAEEVSAPAAPARPAAKAARSAEGAAPGLRPVGAKQWVAASVLVALAVVGLATIVVAIVRWIIGLEPVAAFVERYPGTYALPEGAPVGIPAWLNWSHFFNILLIALIIRSGLQVRRERKPPAYVTSRRTGAKVSLTVWLHTSVDVLWVVNGIVFVVLLFATGQWMRIVPTSWEVFPHAISTALQYASLDWPLEDGWVHYNAMQQLAYFATVFIAAPLAIITGVRMSGWWPKEAERLNRAYPIEWARAVHFPTMLYFVAFIIVHVLLVFTTGALVNLNHMFAAKPDDDWLGFLLFAGAMLVTAAAVIAARPALLSPIASRFGTVSAR